MIGYAGAYMFAENNVTNLVNIYFVGDPAGNCGYFSPSGKCHSCGNSCAGTSNTTIAHELGHFFSLPILSMAGNSTLILTTRNR